MNLNYAIFRSEPIYTLQDLAQIGSHNKREKKAYKSNPDIEIELSKNNIELVPLTEKYVKGFYNLTKDYRKEHEERYRKLIENIEGGLVFSRDGDKIWKCRNCGHIVIGKEAPKVCPICTHPQSYFEIKAENY